MAEMRAELGRQIAAAGGVCAFARRHGINHTAVSLSKHGKRPVAEEVANACGFLVETTFKNMRG